MSFIMSGAVKEIMTLEKHDDYQLAGKTGSFFFG
jgi:beta-lactamase class D